MFEHTCARRVLRHAACALLLAGAFALPAWAQAPPASAAAQPGTPSGEKFLNVKVLKDLSAVQMHDAMVFMEAALGTTCEGCHVRGADGKLAFDKDDKRSKQTTRKMIQLVDGVNSRDFNGEPQVTCMTCHQGRLSPASVPTLASLTPTARPAVPASAPPAAAGSPTTPATAGGPPAAPGARQRPTETIDQVAAKFVEALGGRDALAAVTSRTRKGSVTTQTGQTSPVSIDEKGDGLFVATIGSTPALAEGVNAEGTWRRAGDRVRDMTGVEAAAVAVKLDLTLPLDLTKRYTNLAVRAYGAIDGQAVIVVNGRSSPDVIETMYFDRASGLLLRRVVRLGTSMGRLPVQVDYADYRAVGKVKMPYEVRVADWESAWAMKFTDITLNPALDDGRFAKPAAPGQ